MKFSPEIAELSGVVSQMYERLLAKRYHEVIFHDLAYRGVGPDFAAHCPFHENSSVPSLLISGTAPTWQCFAGCGKGTWIRFLQKREGLTFWAALDRLTLAAQIDLRHFPLYERWKRETEQVEIYERTLQHLQKQLQEPGGKEVRDYLAARKISAAQISAMELGAIPSGEELQKFLENSDFDKDLLFGSTREGRPGAFGGVVALGTHRVVLPFRDEIGRIFSLFTRTTPATTPKVLEKYRPVSHLTDEREILFGMWTASETGRVLVVEGSFDCARASLAGIPNVVATNGVSILPAHLSIMRRKGVKKILLLPDTDKVGQETAVSTVDMLAMEGFDCAVVEIPHEFKDVDSLLGELGAVGLEILHAAIRQATPSMQWRARRFAESHAKDQQELLKAAVQYSTKISRPEDCAAFLLSLMGHNSASLAALDQALQKLAQDKLPGVWKCEYLVAARNCARALESGRLAEFEAANILCKELLQKLK